MFFFSNTSSNGLFKLLSIKDILVDILVNFLFDSLMRLFITQNLTFPSFPIHQD